MPKTCLTCLSHDDLSDLGKREWKVLEYLIYPSKKSLSGILKANRDAGICSKCQLSIISVDEFRTSAMGNFVKLLEAWGKVKGIICQSSSDQMTQNLNNKREKGTQTGLIDIKIEPFPSEEHTSFNYTEPEHVFKKEVSLYDDASNKDAIKNPILTNMLQNMCVMKPPGQHTNTSNFTVMSHVPKNIESKLYSDIVKEETEMFSRIPDAQLNRIDNADNVHDEEDNLHDEADVVHDEADVVHVQLESKVVHDIIYDNITGKNNKVSTVCESGKLTVGPDGLLNTNTQKITIPSTSATSIKYKCKHCDKSYMSSSGLWRHEQIKHNVLKPVMCTVCSKTMRNKLCLKKHMKIHEIKDLHCKVCDKYFSKETYNQHFKESAKHLGNYDGMFKCQHCNKSYCHKKSLQHHIYVVHGAKNKQEYCSLCDKWFSLVSYQNHLKYTLKHNGEEKQRYICDYCNKKFLRKIDLEFHIKVVHLKLKPFKCLQCPRSFARRYTLNKHIRHDHENVPEPKNHICEVCGSAFKTGSLLRNHMAVHTGARPYKCEKCDATFGHSSALFLHKRYKHEKMKCPPKKKKMAASSNK